jgi:hypothetical protein
MAIRLLKRKRNSPEETDDPSSTPSPWSMLQWSPWKILAFFTVVAAIFVVVLRYDTGTVVSGMGDTMVESSSSSSATTPLKEAETMSTIRDYPTTTPNMTPMATTLKPTAPNVTVEKIPATIPPIPPPASQSENSPAEYDPNAPLTVLEVAPSHRYHVFQFSGTGVASTLSVNLLTGLFEGKEQGMAYWECKYGDKGKKEKDRCTWWQRFNGIRNLKSPDLMNTTIVTKTHVQDADQLMEWFKDDFDHLFLVGNERKDHNKVLPKQYCANDTYPNVLCLEYNDLQYNDEEGLRKVVRYVKDRIYQSFPYFANVQLKEEETVQRLLDMAESYKGTPGYDDNRYGIGGGHSKSHTLQPSSTNQQQQTAPPEEETIPNSETTQQDATTLDHLEVAPSRLYHVFQFSGTGVASTMTVNLLTGLFEGTEQGMAYWECKYSESVKEQCTFWQRLNHINGISSADLINSTIVTKTHVENVDTLQSWFGSDFDKIFFIGNERKDLGKLLPKEYCAEDSYPNVMCLEYNDLQYSDEESMRKVVKYVKDRIHHAFPYFANVQLKEEEAVQRLLDMAESYKGTPGYITNRYGIGGGNAKSHILDDNS